MDDQLTKLLSQTGDIALRRRARWLIQSLELKNGDTILDVGCGDGYYLYLLANLVLKLKLIGVDSDERALASARINLPKSIALVKGDLLALPFTQTFDTVVVSEVLEHIENDQTATSEIYRVLKPGGQLVVSVPHHNYPFLWDPINWLLEHAFNTHIKSGFWAGIWNQHLRLYTVNQLKSVLKKSGLRDIEITALTHYCLPFNHYLINIAARIIASGNLPHSGQTFSKFSSLETNKKKFNLFYLLFLFDRLNDLWNGRGTAVSLVARAKK